MLGVYVVAYAELVGLSLVLSLFDAMTRGALVAGSALVFAAMIGVWALARGPRPPMAPLRLVRLRGPVLFLAIVVALALAYVVALIVGTAPNGWDPLNYHLARAAFWAQSGHVGYIPDAYDQRLNFNPPHAEIGLAFVLSVTRHETLAGLVQFFAALACGVGVFALARCVGLRRNEAAFGALLFLTLPIVLLQSSGVKNDLVVASFLVAASVFVLGESRGEICLAALATALAMGTKFTAAYGLVVLLALAVIPQPRGRRAWRIGCVALGAIAGSYWYAVNLHDTGHLLGDQASVPGLTAPLQPPENLVTAYGDLVDTLDLSGARGRDIALYVVAAALLAALLGLRRAKASHVLLAGAVALLPLPLLLLSDEVARPSLLHLYDIVGKPQAYLAVGDEVSSSPTTASDTASWFGPVGLFLVVATAVVAARLWRRHSLPRLAILAAVAPLLWLVLVALTLTYHPWQGRFFVFPLYFRRRSGGSSCEYGPPRGLSSPWQPRRRCCRLSTTWRSLRASGYSTAVARRRCGRRRGGRFSLNMILRSLPRFGSSTSACRRTRQLASRSARTTSAIPRSARTSNARCSSFPSARVGVTFRPNGFSPTRSVLERSTPPAGDRSYGRTPARSSSSAATAPKPSPLPSLSSRRR